MNLLGHIPYEQFCPLIKATQLVSVDILFNIDGKYLLGKRRNKPAQDMYFVPGGKVRNNETIKEGLHRIIQSEIGLTDYSRKLIGAYEHIYADNVFGTDNGTHYIVFAFSITSNQLIDEQSILSQHTNYIWSTPIEIINDTCVHEYTKYYFQSDAPNIII
jgi:colanic acid biosynthesis protein WcaH